MINHSFLIDNKIYTLITTSLANSNSNMNIKKTSLKIYCSLRGFERPFVIIWKEKKTC